MIRAAIVGFIAALCLYAVDESVVKPSFIKIVAKNPNEMGLNFLVSDEVIHQIDEALTSNENFKLVIYGNAIVSVEREISNLD